MAPKPKPKPTRKAPTRSSAPNLLARYKRLFELVEKKYLPAGFAPRGRSINYASGERSAWRSACDEVGIPASGSLFATAVRVLGREPDWSRYKAKPDAPANAVPTRERQAAADKLATQGKALREAHRALNAMEDLRRGVFRLAEPMLAPPPWVIAPKPSGPVEELPILFTSDKQWGEHADRAALGGANAYNIDIARRRYKRLIERTIDLCMNHMVKPRYPGILYLRGGDEISGDIHDELRKTNDLQSIPAVRDLVEHEVAGITALAAAFGKVHVISVPGNHGRTTIKPESKRAVETNYDTLSAWMIEQWFTARGDKRVSVWTPPSGDALFRAMGWTLLLTHGDKIGSRGGQGFIGPAATIARGAKRVRDYYAALGAFVDYMFFGHFHTRLELEFCFSNGSFPGLVEYARDGRTTPSPPEQWLLFLHARRGITARWPIALEDRPRVEAPRAVFEELHAA
jgi:hypothetical protein